MSKKVTKDYWKVVSIPEFVGIVAKLMQLELDQIVIVSRPLVAPSGAVMSFKVKDDDDNCEYMVIANPFECRVFTAQQFNYDTTFKKQFGVIISEMVDKGRRYGKTKLTSVEYQKDYNDYHTQKFEEQQAKAEQEHLQQLL